MFYSDVFALGKSNVDAEWSQFVAESYKAENARCRRESDEQSTREKKAETKKALSAFAGHQGDVETGWKPAGAEPMTSGTSGSQPQTQAPNNPSGNTANSTLETAIDNERVTLVPYCQNNVSLGALLDCTCMADAVYAARLKGPTTASHGAPTAHGPRTILEPQLGQLIESLDLRSCATKERLDAYSMKRTTNTLRASVKEPRLSELGACVAQRFSGQVASDPKALTHIEIIDNDFTSNLSFCNQKIR